MKKKTKTRQKKTRRRKTIKIILYYQNKKMLEEMLDDSLYVFYIVSYDFSIQVMRKLKILCCELIVIKEILFDYHRI